MKKSIIVTKAIIRNKKGACLLVKRADNDQIHGRYWELPGGEIEFGESLEECCKREVKEEVSLDIDVKQIAYTWSEVKDELHIIGINFFCEADTANISLSDEHSDFKWVNKDNYLNLKMSSGLKKDFQKHLL